MKRLHIFLVIFLITAAVLAAATLILNSIGVSAFGAFVEKPDIKEIESEQLLQVKQAYLDMKMKTGYPDSMTTDYVCIEEYCGVYNDCIVVMFTDSQTGYLQAIQVINIAGVNIRYNYSNELYAYKDGSIYTLEQAYVAGILTKPNIRNIRDIHDQY